jgi:DNA-directed RNA polymerase specialized sigma24 family protein
LENARDRAMLRMHYFDEMELPEIAKELNIPLSGAYVVKFRALKRLRSILEGSFPDGNAPQS